MAPYNSFNTRPAPITRFSTHRPGLGSTMRWPYFNEVIVFFDRNWTFPRRTSSWIVICKPCAMMNILPRCCRKKPALKELFFERTVVFDTHHDAMVLREKLFKRYTLWHGSQLTFQFCFQVGKSETKEVPLSKGDRMETFGPSCFSDHPASTRSFSLQVLSAISDLRRSCPYATVAVGLSNLSAAFGQMGKLREALHSTFLQHAIPKGGGVWSLFFFFFGESEVADMVKGLCSWDGT